MTNKDFNKIVEKRLETIRETLIKKGAEYASVEDRLHNFKRGAQISGEIPEKVLQGFMLKHLVSYLDILDKLGKEEISISLIEEKLNDLLCYLILQETLIKERIVK